MKVLVVDDDASTREIFAITLESVGHEVEVAFNGRMGLEAARARRPGLILMDASMPELSGVEACVALRADTELSALAIVLVTARGSDEDLEAGRAAGANDYITKPITPSELLARLEPFLKD